MKASIIIPVFNKWDLTRDCLLSLRETVPPGMAEVIVVDNASSDATMTELPTGFPEVRYLRQEENTGFARGNNIGARVATGDYVLLLNNDTKTLPGWLEPIFEVFEQSPKAGVVGSKLLYPDRHIQHAGVAFNVSRDPFHIYRNAPPDFHGVNKLRQFPAVTGACFTVPRGFYAEMGGLREDYLNGYEDVDFCLRATEAGRESWYQPRSVVFHYESQTPGRKKHEDENRAIFFGRWREKLRTTSFDVYREDGFDASLFPLIEWMTYSVEASHYLPTRWRMTPKTTTRVRDWVARFSAESLAGAETMEVEGTDPGAVGEVRTDFRYLKYSIGVDSTVDGLAGSMTLGEAERGRDARTGREVQFPPGLAPSMSVQLFSMYLRVNHPRWLVQHGLKLLGRGEVEGGVYADEFSRLWPRSPECLKFKTENLLQSGRVDEARQALSAFYENDRYNTYATLQLADALMRTGETPRARQILDDFLKIKPAHLRARYLRWRGTR